MLEHPSSSPPIAQLAQELKSIPVDWAVGLHRNWDEFTVWWESSILDHLVQMLTTPLQRLPREKKLLCRNRQWWKTPSHPVCETSHMPWNQCRSIWAFPSELLRPDGYFFLLLYPQYIFLCIPEFKNWDIQIWYRSSVIAVRGAGKLSHNSTALKRCISAETLRQRGSFSVIYWN